MNSCIRIYHIAIALQRYVRLYLTLLLCEALQKIVWVGQQDRHTCAGLRPGLVLCCSTLEKHRRRNHLTIYARSFLRPFLYLTTTLIPTSVKNDTSLMNLNYELHYRRCVGSKLLASSHTHFAPPGTWTVHIKEIQL